eukprot:2508463-Amphidinium_carterae.1
MKRQLWTMWAEKFLRRPTWPCSPKAKSVCALERKGLHKSVTRSAGSPKGELVRSPLLKADLGNLRRSAKTHGTPGVGLQSVNQITAITQKGHTPVALADDH